MKDKNLADYGGFAIPVITLVLLGLGFLLQVSTFESIVRIFNALLTPVIAAIAIYIAYQQKQIAREQAKTAQRKLRLDTFDKRFAVFTGLMEFLANVLSRGMDQQNLYKFDQDTKGSYFLFDREIDTYLNDVRSKAIDLRTVREELTQDSLLAPGDRSGKIQKQADLLQWLGDQFEAARQKFSKYLSLDFD